MQKIQVCMGNSCRLKGAPLVAHAFVAEIKKRGLTAQVEVNGDFCQSQCREGIIVKIDGEYFTHVRPIDVPELISHYLDYEEE